MNSKKVSSVVEKIINDVRRDRDEALIRYAKKFDKVVLTAGTIKVPQAHIRSAIRRISPKMKKALLDCARRIERFHQNEKKNLARAWMVEENGVRLGQRLTPLSSVGLYVPGGRFAYPSTVLMTAIPARLAGVERIVMVTPPARLSDEILAAASMARVSEIYRVGGPASLAALALGTPSIRKVDFIVGPGNALVTEAKRQLFGIVGIDLLAGPSELVVLADDSATAQYVAADLAAQAEHDPDSMGVLVSLSRKLIVDVKSFLPRALHRQCRFIFEPNSDKALLRVDQWAGEHVEVLTKNPSWWISRLRHGGTFFEGSYSPAVMGDYWAGPSHVLPTGRSARFASGLSVMTFMKRSGYVKVSKRAFEKGWKNAHQVAVAEGLIHHARALKIRMEKDEKTNRR